MVFHTLGVGKEFADIAAMSAAFNGTTFTEDHTVSVYGTAYMTGKQTVGTGITFNGFKLIIQSSSGPTLAAGRLYPLATRDQLQTSADYALAFEFIGSVVVAGLQLSSTGSNANTLVTVNGGAQVKNCILHRTAGTGWMVNTSGSTGQSRIENCLLLPNISSYGIMGQVGPLIVRNCTIVGGGGVGLRSEYGGISAHNTVVFNAVTDSMGTNTGGGTNNATSKSAFDAASFGTNGILGVTSEAFVSVASGSEDYSLAPGSVLINAGATTDVVIDAFGTSRPRDTLYDIGAAEYVAASGSVSSLTVTTGAAVFAGIASVSPLTVLTATMADSVFSGSIGSGATASLSITTGAAIFSGTASVSGAASITLPALKNNTGTVLANETGATVYVYATTGAHVVTKTAQTTNASGVMVIADAALTAATQYRVVVVLASGAEGMDKATAA